MEILKKLIKPLLILSFIASFTINSYAQNCKHKTDSLKQIKCDSLKQLRLDRLNQTDRYNILETGLSYSNVQDTKMSPVIYSGPGIGLGVGSFITVNKFTHFTDFNIHYAALLGPNQMGSMINAVDFRFNKGVLYKLNSEKWKLGGSTNIEAHGRIYPKIVNDAVNVDILATINFAASYTTDFTFLKRNNTLDIRAELPVFAFSMRYPDYCFSGINYLYMPIGVYKAMRTKITIIRPFKYSNENRYSVSYQWDLYAFNEYQGLFHLVSGAHFITIGFWLKTK